MQLCPGRHSPQHSIWASGTAANSGIESAPKRNPFLHRPNTFYLPQKGRRLFHSSRNIHL